MEKKIHKLKSVKLDKIVEIIESLEGKTPELEIRFENPKEFKPEQDEFIHSIAELLKHYFSNDDLIIEEDTKDCIFNAIERFATDVEFLTPLKKKLESIHHWKLKAIDVRKPNESRFGKIIISAIFENKWYYLYMNFYVADNDPLHLKIEFVIPKEIFKKYIQDKYFEEVEVEKWYEEYIALQTTCKKLLEDKLYWQGRL